MVTKWTFLDPVDSSLERFDVNPNVGGTPSLERTITSHSTLVPGGKTIIFEGAKKPEIIEFSGIIYNSTELDKFEFWFSKLHQVQLTDDLGRSMMVMMTEFNPKRVRFGHNFWRHTYDAKLTVVDWP